MDYLEIVNQLAHSPREEASDFFSALALWVILIIIVILCIAAIVFAVYKLMIQADYATEGMAKFVWRLVGIFAFTIILFVVCFVSYIILHFIFL